MMSKLCRFIKLYQRPFWSIGWLTTPDLISSDANGYFRSLLNSFGMENRSRLAINFGGIPFYV